MTRRYTEYMPLAALKPALRNPKEHDLPSIVASLRRYGIVGDACVIDERTGRLLGGHGRNKALIQMRAQGDPMPGGVELGDDGDWWIPVSRGLATRNDDEADALIITLNRLSEAGGWHMVTLAQMIEDVIAADAPLLETMGFTDEAIDNVIARVDPELLNRGQEMVADMLDTITPPEPKPSSPKAPDPDPHMPLPDESESVVKTTPHTCPSCGHHWKD